MLPNEHFSMRPLVNDPETKQPFMYFVDRPEAPTYLHATAISQAARDPLIFDALAANGFACFQAVSIMMDHPEAPYWYRKLAPEYEQFAFVAGLGTSVNMRGVENEGQWLFAVKHPETAGIFTVVDIACYLFELPHSKMPIVTGEIGFIQEMLSSLYTELLQKTFNVEILKQIPASMFLQNVPWHKRR